MDSEVTSSLSIAMSSDGYCLLSTYYVPGTLRAFYVPSHPTLTVYQGGTIITSILQMSKQPLQMSK